MIFTRIFMVSLLGVLLLSGCGFKPMYGESAQTGALSEDFSKVGISPIEDRIGQVVRNHLLDRINPYGEPSAPDYLFRVSLEESREGFGFRRDESVTRESLTLTAFYQLVDQQSGEVLVADQVRAVQAYDVVQSDFANFSARQDATERTALRIAEMLTARLGLYFKMQDNAADSS